MFYLLKQGYRNSICQSCYSHCFPVCRLFFLLPFGIFLHSLMVKLSFFFIFCIHFWFHILLNCFMRIYFFISLYFTYLLYLILYLLYFLKLTLLYCKHSMISHKFLRYLLYIRVAFARNFCIIYLAILMHAGIKIANTLLCKAIVLYKFQLSNTVLFVSDE